MTFKDKQSHRDNTWKLIRHRNSVQAKLANDTYINTLFIYIHLINA